jgi:hypothetical protein
MRKLILLFCCCANLFAQKNDMLPSHENSAENPCITLEQYELIQKRCHTNLQKMGNPPLQKSMLVSLDWPLAAASGFNDCSYYSINNYVDHNPSSAVTDYNCGNNTYDGHRGIDIDTWPFPFYKMDYDQVTVIAAANGTIIDKADGNFDKNCAFSSTSANYIIIQHIDGSRALYWHMKNGSLTSKTIGQTVSTGEYLGIVGSSGSSTNPHLHFEVWANSSYSSLIDPYAGTCNTLNSSAWWTSQKPYTEPAIINIAVNYAPSIMPDCPNTETPNESNCYQSNSFAYFTYFFRNEQAGLNGLFRILNPDGTVNSSWTHNSTYDYEKSWWYWNMPIPSNVAGTYTFEGTYNGQTCSKNFDVAYANISPAGATSFCSGGSVNLLANSGIGINYQWKRNGDDVGTNSPNYLATLPGSYACVVSTANGCYAISNSIDVEVVPSPTPIIAGDNSICVNNIETYNVANPITGSTYVWSVSNGTILSGQGTAAITVQWNNGTAGSIFVTQTNP